MAVLMNKSSVSARTVVAKQTRSRTVSVIVRASQPSAESVSRRATLGAFVGAAALLTNSSPSLAAFGDSANVFGRVTNTSGFAPYVGEDFALLLPAKWNPSKERDFKGVKLRYEDNGDAVNTITVISNPTDKADMAAYGEPEKFLNDISYLLGKQSYAGQTQSEGGFAPDRVSAASLLNVSQETDKKGKTYYQYELLTRTADGDEGGRHHLFKATVSNGNLYILKIQVGDKRWFKGVDKDATKTFQSFTVA
ncbi:MAG: hypothetical protein WDW38_006234 [Sanguina aurantia]